MDVPTFWRSVLAHDRANPGFMQNHGQEIIQAFNQSRGGDALQNFMNPGSIPSVSSALGNLFRNDYTETDQARAALRHYMGLGKPVSIGGRGLFGWLPGASAWTNPHQGMAPIPGSPGAQ
jgi:hypothetical protein